MLDHDAAKSLVRYKTWADSLTLSAVAGLPPGEAARERPTLFKSIIGTLNHSCIVDLIWQAHLEGREHGFTARKQIPSGPAVLIPHSQAGSTAAISPVIARSQEGLVQGGASIYGNFSARSTARKRGSLRSGSMSGSVRKPASPGSRRRIAFSSQSNAALFSPHWA